MLNTENTTIQEHDSTVIRGHRINFFDDVEVYYASEFLDWEDFKNNPKRKDVFIEKIQGHSERTYDTSIWKEDIKDCVYTNIDYGTHDTLIILLVSENWLQDDLLAVPDCIMKYRKKSDILILKEEIKSYRKPLFHHLMMGLNDKYNTFEKMCNLLRKKYINENYEKVLLISGDTLAPAGLALAQEFSDIISDTIISDGITTFDWETSSFIQLCHHMSMKSEYMFKKTGRHDMNSDLMKTTEDARYVLKAGYFARHKINKRLTSPFEFVDNHKSLNIEYYYWKDNYHIEWLRKNVKETNNFKMINVKNQNPPITYKEEILPLFLYKKLDR